MSISICLVFGSLPSSAECAVGSRFVAATASLHCQRYAPGV
jgi:hypothetical protein